MTPEYLMILADLADPDKLWQFSGIYPNRLTAEQKYQVDTGVALRRHAAYVLRLRELIGTGKSLVITPTSPNGRIATTMPTPPDHQKLIRK